MCGRLGLDKRVASVASAGGQEEVRAAGGSDSCDSCGQVSLVYM